METTSSSRRFLSRSWVSGRWVATPWRAKAMAVASTLPIQMGRKRSPSRSLRSTIGVWVGSSILTPTRVSSTNAKPPRASNVPGALAGACRTARGYQTPSADATYRAKVAAGRSSPRGRRRGRVRPGRLVEQGRVGADRVQVVDGQQLAPAPLALVQVKAVPDQEHVGDLEANIGQGDVNDPPGPLVQQGTDPQAGRPAGGQHPEQVGEGQPGVDDVLDHQHVGPGQVQVEVLLDPDHPGVLGGVEPRDGHEVGPAGHRRRPDQVGQEDHPAPQHRHQDGLDPLVVGPQLGPPFLQRLPVDEEPHRRPTLEGEASRGVGLVGGRRHGGVRRSDGSIVGAGAPGGTGWGRTTAPTVRVAAGSVPAVAGGAATTVAVVVAAVDAGAAGWVVAAAAGGGAVVVVVLAAGPPGGSGARGTWARRRPPAVNQAEAAPGARARRTWSSWSRRTRASTSAFVWEPAGRPAASDTGWPRWASRARTYLENPYSNRARTSAKALGVPMATATRRRPPRLAEATRHRPARLVNPVLPPTTHR